MASDDLANVPIDETPAPFDPEEIAQLSDAVAALPPASQIVIRMHYLDGLTQLEVAEALESSVGTVKSRISYGLATLREAISPAR